jgi:hypothetical protein
MIPRLNQLALVVAAAVFAWVGVTGLLAPETIAGPVALGIETTSARNEIRANYGGMHLGVCVLFGAGAFVARLRRFATLLLTVFTGGLVAGRVLSMLVDGMPNAFVIQLLILEAVSAGAGAALLWGRESERRAQPPIQQARL